MVAISLKRFLIQFRLVRSAVALVLFAMLSFALVSGCNNAGVGDDPARTGVESRVVPDPGRASVTLQVGVVEDAQLADAIRRLRGEWAEATGGELTVADISRDEALGLPVPQKESHGNLDLLIFPSRHLGELCERSRLRPMRRSVLESEDLKLNDIASLVREKEIVYGGVTMALPIGSPVPLLVFSPNRGEATPPTAWSQLPPNFSYEAVAPTAEGHAAALQFLLRLACYSSHPSRKAVLFDRETMLPQLAETPALRAMEAMHGFSAKDQPIHTAVYATHQAFTERAVVWPMRKVVIASANDSLDREQAAAEKARITPLPGTEQIYNPTSQEWEPVPGNPRHVTLLATSGRLVGVTSETRNAATAFRLAAWLAGPTNARQLSTASPNVANVRKSLARVPDDWTGLGNKSLGKQFSAALGESLNHPHGFVMPRIFRTDDYLAALDTAVRDVIAKNATPEQALRTAADEWEKLTDEIGREKQRKAYLRHLGLENYEYEKK